MTSGIFLLIFFSCTTPFFAEAATKLPRKAMSAENFKQILASERDRDNDGDVSKNLRMIALDTSKVTDPSMENIVKNAEDHLKYLAEKQKFSGRDDEENRVAAERQMMLSGIFDAEMRQGAGKNIGAQRARQLLGPDKEAPSTNEFIRRHRGKLGTGLLYVGPDSFLQQHESNKVAEALEGKTLSGIMAGFKDSDHKVDGQNSIEKMFRYFRPLTRATYGIMPFAPDLMKNKRIKGILPAEGMAKYDFTPQGTADKALGGANLATLTASLLYNAATEKDATLDAREAYYLSYFNRRNGVPTDITAYKNSIKRLAKTRLGVQMLGEYAAPILLAFLLNKRPPSSDGTTFSPAIAVANAASITDTLIGMYQRYKQKEMMKSIKRIVPFVEQELALNPPTMQEQAADKASSAAERMASEMVNHMEFD